MHRALFLCFFSPALFSPAQTVAPSDPNYRALRDAVPQESYGVENLRLVRDLGILTLKTGTVTFLAPVQGRRYLAVFRGEGTFELTPTLDIEANNVAQFTGKKQVSVNVQRALLAFGDSTYEEIAQNGKAGQLDPEAAKVLDGFRKKLRKEGEDNVEAALLGDVYNPKRPPSFAVFMSGRDADDLRFFVNPQGAVADLPPEEVGLITVAKGSDRSGIWYLSHLQS